MHFHPKDTYDAFKPSNKEKNAHLAYHINFNVMMEDSDSKTRKFKPKKIEPIHTVHSDLKQLAKTIESNRSYVLASASDFLSVRQLQGEIESRMLIGLGSGHVNETALTIHPVYGIPYVPASSLKGLVRNWFIHAYCDGDEKRLEDHSLATMIFGTNTQRGLVQFYDIYLYHDLQIEGDIIAVHFPKYYSGKLPATDDQNVNPVQLRAAKVKKANIFLSMAKNHIDGELIESQILDAAVMWTAQALKEFGIGSKTSLGYGVFSNVRDVTDTEFIKVLKGWKEEVEKENIRKKEIEVNNMSPEEQLLYYINQLTERPEDIEKSKASLFEKVVESKSKKAAQALKEYWERTGQWKVKKRKKQFIKVSKINDLLK